MTHPTAAAPNPGVGAVGPAWRTAGWLLLVLPWALDPVSAEPFSAPQWVVLALGWLVIAWRARTGPASAAPGEPAADLRVPLARGGFGLVAAGALLAALASAAPLLGLAAGLRHVALLALVPLLVRSPLNRACATWLARCLILSAAAQASLMLLQLGIGNAGGSGFPIPTGQHGRAAMVGTLGNPEYVASFVALGMAAWLGTVWAGRLAPATSPRSPWSIAASWSPLVMLPALLLGGGRAAVLCLALATLVGWLVARRAAPIGLRPRRKLVLIAAGLLLALILLALILLPLALPAGLRAGTLPARLAELFNPQSTSMRHRLGLLVVSADVLADAPLLGVGGGQFGAAFTRALAARAEHEPGIGFWAYAATLRGSYVAEAHCDPLQWWIEYGLLGWLGLALLSCAALWYGAPRPAAPRYPELWLPSLTLAFNAWLAFPLHEPVRAACAGLLLAALLAPAAAAAPRPAGVFSSGIAK